MSLNSQLFIQDLNFKNILGFAVMYACANYTCALYKDAC